MDASTVALIVGLTTATTTSVGWIVLHYLTRKREIEARQHAWSRDLETRDFTARKEEDAREKARAQADQTRRLEIRLRYHERQIQEFYAPLWSNIHLIWAVWTIGERLKFNLSDADNETALSDVQISIRGALSTKYYTSLHAENREILKTKLFLMEGVDLPQSFFDYLEHSMMDDVKRRLLDDNDIKTDSVVGKEWPDKFPIDVKAGLDKALRAYDDILEALARPPAIIEM